MPCAQSLGGFSPIAMPSDVDHRRCDDAALSVFFSSFIIPTSSFLQLNTLPVARRSFSSLRGFGRVAACVTAVRTRKSEYIVGAFSPASPPWALLFPAWGLL